MNLTHLSLTTRLSDTFNKFIDWCWKWWWRSVEENTIEKFTMTYPLLDPPPLVMLWPAERNVGTGDAARMLRCRPVPAAVSGWRDAAWCGHLHQLPSVQSSLLLPATGIALRYYVRDGWRVVLLLVLLPVSRLFQVLVDLDLVQCKHIIVQHWQSY